MFNLNYYNNLEFFVLEFFVLYFFLQFAFYIFYQFSMFGISLKFTIKSYLYFLYIFVRDLLYFFLH